MRCFTIRKAAYCVFNLFLHLVGITIHSCVFCSMALDLSNQDSSLIITPLPSACKGKYYLRREMHVMFFPAELLMFMLVKAGIDILKSNVRKDNSSFLELSC